ncbi:MAG TPA: ABC transporter ATP-binding protein, partial [Nitrosomonas sp.]|nr:ABC transporter ATP-binding protein [Nitrosomonas sp.]
MLSEIVIQVKDVAKSYDIYNHPVDRLKQILWRNKREFYRKFWALQGINFEVKNGETIGIIGRNGSGKSTLLQIICGILTPTVGHVNVKGRVAALLELGAGFNPEFTGRENVYLNAAILGLNKSEINERLEDIFAFADIGGFVDQPVKTYSSGMFVRLAFSVAINVEPQILVVDEALAVGDAAFQAKCMARMRRLMDVGVTVLFVSHDLAAVKALCQKAVLLENGRMRAFGSTETVADEYLRLINEGHSSVQNLPIKSVYEKNIDTVGANKVSVGNDEKFKKLAAIQRLGNRKAEFLNVEVLDNEWRPSEAFSHGDVMILRMIIKANTEINYLAFGYHIRDRNGIDVVYADNLLEKKELRNLVPDDIYEIQWSFSLPLTNGHYNVAVVVSSPVTTVSDVVNCSDLAICDFVSVAGQFRVHGDTQIHGYVKLENKINLQR